MRHRAAKAPARGQDRADRRERRDRPVAATTTEPPAAESRFTNLAFVLEGNARKLAGLSVMSIITAFSETFLIASVVQSISALSAGRDTVDLHLGGASVHAGVNLLLGIAVGAAVVRGVLTALVSVSGPRITGASRARLRRRLLSSYLSTDWATQSADKTGRFLQTLSSAVNDANSIILLLTQALPAAITLVVLLAVATVINPIGTAVLLLVGLVIGVALRPISARAHRAARRDSRGRNAIASHVAGVLTAGAEIAVLGSRPGVLRDGDRLIRTTDRAFGRSQGLKRMVATASQSIAFVIATAGLLLVSTSGLDVNFTTLGTITVLLLRGAGLAQQLQTLTSQWGTTVPYIEQVRTLIALYESHRPSYGTSRFPQQFDITLDGVSYTYPGTLTPAVQVESARFAQGSSTAIIGPSGSGKSTLIQLILRLRDPSQGQVMVGPVTAADISEEELGTRLAYVPQSPTLVPGSIFDNIAFFRSGVTREQVVRAAKLAHIHDEIERMTHGYDTVIDAHVDMLSGGQKQRLALARALTRTPSILVLDEPTSALDSTNEQAVIDTLRQLHGSTTVIMITHKASTVTHCDAVLRLEHGTLRSIAGDGTFGPGLMDALPEGRH